MKPAERIHGAIDAFAEMTVRYFCGWHLKRAARVSFHPEEGIDRFHFEYPMYGSRRLAHQFGISRDKAKRLMQDLHIIATYPKRRTTIPNSNHKK